VNAAAQSLAVAVANASATAWARAKAQVDVKGVGQGCASAKASATAGRVFQLGQAQWLVCWQPSLDAAAKVCMAWCLQGSTTS